MCDAGHRTPDIGQRTAEKAKIIYPPPRGVDIKMEKERSQRILFQFDDFKQAICPLTFQV